VAIALAIVLLVGAGLFARDQKGLYARIGGERVTRDDYEKMLSYYTLTDPGGHNTSNYYFTQQVYYYLMVNTARMQLAKDWKITVEESEVDEWYHGAKEYFELSYLLEEADHHEIEYDYWSIIGYGEMEPEEAIAEIEDALGKTASQLFMDTLEELNLSEADVKNYGRINLILMALDKAIEATIEVTDNEIQEIYDLNAEGRFSDLREISHILLSTIDDNYILLPDEEITDIQETIHLLHYMLTEEGADFAELAMEYSDDPGSSAQGGYLGKPYSVGELFSDLVPNFAAAAAELTEPGQISEVINTEFGYHILRLDDLISQSYEDAYETIKGELITTKAAEMHKKLLEGVTIAPKELKVDLIEIGW